MISWNLPGEIRVKQHGLKKNEHVHLAPSFDAGFFDDIVGKDKECVHRTPHSVMAMDSLCVQRTYQSV